MTTRYTDCTSGDGWHFCHSTAPDDSPVKVFPRCASQYIAYDPVTEKFVPVQDRYNVTGRRATVVRLDMECVA